MLNSSARTAEAVRAGLDGAALKPAECDVRRATDLPLDAVTIDYEGHEHVPDASVLERLARERDVRLTIPVRADGFDPVGDDGVARALPETVGRVYVAGHPAYLSAEERRRTVGDRLAVALDEAGTGDDSGAGAGDEAGDDSGTGAGDEAADEDGAGDAWVGTEGVERIALATGATQFELLSRTTAGEFRAIRAAGFDGDLAVYAPTVLTDDVDAILDAVGGYVARRRPVAEALPDEAAADATAEGRAREVLVAATGDYALTGTPDDVREQVEALRDAGADLVVGYPARGIDEFCRPASASD